MITVGVDLAAQAVKTGLAAIDWSEGRAEVTDLRVNVTNADIVAATAGAAKVGIDCPLGWPIQFVEFITAHGLRQLDPSLHVVDGLPTWNRSLTLRRTDQYVKEQFKLNPLSVSANLIGVTAMRCAVLLAQLGNAAADRTGGGKVVEVYPAASLSRWDLPSRGYKNQSPDELLVREKILSELERRCPWLLLPPVFRTRCKQSDHALDAFVAALTARSAERRGVQVPAECVGEARVEGWIYVPPAALEELIA
jgi:predicted nuclease with RNAse H fold